MRICDSSLLLTASHTSVARVEQRESLSAWQRNPDGSRSTVQLRRERVQEDISHTLSLSSGVSRTVPPAERFAALKFHPDPQPGHGNDGAHRMQLTPWRPSTPSAPPPPPAPVEQAAADDRKELRISTADDFELLLIKLLVERFTGRKVETVEAAELRAAGDVVVQPPPAGEPGRNGNAGWGAVYHYEETRYEAETLAFQASGTLHTADGRTIDINLELTMSREYVSRTGLTVRAGEALKDPLIINFDGSAAELSGTPFLFDLDADGTREELTFVGANSGLLALDTNGDGVINDGRELFGPVSNDGFAELARHDGDGNGWIDEADAVFDRLLIWTKAADGADRLAGLRDYGIGALYLGSTATPFQLKDPANQLLGAVRASGLYLNENGGAGTLQQLDLKV